MKLVHCTILASAAMASGAASIAWAAGTFDAVQSNPCLAWNLSNKDLQDCSSAWNAAKDEDARARVRTMFELRGALAPAAITTPARKSSASGPSASPGSK